VETAGHATRGVLLIDYYNLLKKNPNLELVMGVDKMAMRRVITHSLSSLKGVSIPEGWILPGCIVGVCLLGVVMVGFVLLVKKVASFGQGSREVVEEGLETTSVETEKPVNQ
jgi:hypothetical protein